MRHRVYDSPAWDTARTLALARDGDRCTVARLLGGSCHPRLDVHHVHPVEEGGAPYDVDNLLTVCAAHHPMLEAFRRHVIQAALRPAVPRCPHHHPYPQGRAECERRLARSA